MKSKIFIATVILFGTLLSSFKNPANDQFVKFTIKNAGISVEGLFDKFQVKVVFDESNLAQSSFMQSFTLAPWALRGMTKLAVGKTI
jgi:polyisoprenoid-binding protein YceI